MKYDLEPRGWIVAEETFDPCRTAKCESLRKLLKELLPGEGR